MKTIAAAKFKARCLKVMDEVRAKREPVTITKKGRPIAKLVPAGEPAEDAFGCLAGTLEIVGDIETPVIPAEAWNASR
jgi:prevent-host-death family protein